MMLDTKRISPEARDVAIGLTKKVDITVDEALIYMVEAFARGYDGNDRAPYKW